MGSGFAPEVDEPFGDLLRVLHLRDGDLLELTLHGEPLHAGHLDVLPHVLHGDLDLAGDRLVQHLHQLLRRFRALHRDSLLCRVW
jgi:hypothetical protein